MPLHVTVLHISNEQRVFSGLPWKSNELAVVRELHISIPRYGNGRNTGKSFYYFMQALGRNNFEET